MSLLKALSSDLIDPIKIKHFLDQIFDKNMAFFKAKAPLLHNLLAKNNGAFELVINEFGINIAQNKQLIYPKIDGKYTFLQTQYEIAQNALNNPRWEVLKNDVLLNFMDTKKLEITGSANNELIHLAKTLGGSTSYKIPANFYPNVAIFGILGGAFLQFMLDKGAHFHSFFLFEESEDLFKISAHFIDFERLFKATTKQNCFIFVKNINANRINFFENRKVSSNFLLQILQMYNSKELDSAKNRFLSDFNTNKRGWGSFEDEKIGLINSLSNAKNTKNTIFNPQKLPVFGAKNVSQAPYICVVGNGPSLDYLIPFIKNNANKMLILSCGTALGVLQKHEITPDFHIEIERTDYLSDILKKQNLQNVELICANMVDPNVLSLSDKACIFIRGGSASSYLFKARELVLSSPFVGNAGLSLALLLSPNVIIAGLDCGYILGLSKHASGSFYGKEGTNIPQNSLKMKPNFNEKADEAFVKKILGINKYEIFLDSLFLLSKKNLELLLNAHKKINNNSNIFNISFGAQLSGAIAIKPADLESHLFKIKIDKTQLKEKLKEAKTKAILIDKNNLLEDNFISHIFNFLQKNANFVGIYELLRDFNATQADLTQKFFTRTDLAITDQAEGALPKRDALTKYELFILIDCAISLMLQKSRQKPEIGLLFEGSFLHLMQTLLLCALHLEGDNILIFYKMGIEVLEVHFRKMWLEFRLLINANL
ncbi:MAG: 6-hydroxymethylpterin diphosphokinase MptE-like protein [Helicobacter sp.]|nr:6-hydroxymethylpterin diphosphokinase MptE-like protein [Helicobacter sp.]